MQTSAHSLLHIPQHFELCTSKMELFIFPLNLSYPRITDSLTNSTIIHSVTKQEAWEPFFSLNSYV